MEISIKQQGTTENGNPLYILQVDGIEFGEPLTKVELMRKLWRELQLPEHFWDLMKVELGKLN